MAAVLCFGDSNTWGTVPLENRRYNESERWPALLKNMLQNSEVTIEVIEEGQPGRTLVHHSPYQGDKSGQRYLKDCLVKYTPELVVILLGTNDLKKRYALSAQSIAKSAAKLARQTLQFSNPLLKKPIQVILIAPPLVCEVGFYANMYAGAAEKSAQLAKYYEQYAIQTGCVFFDASRIVTACPEEGIHWQADQHQRLAKALAPLVRSLLNDENMS